MLFSRVLPRLGRAAAGRFAAAPAVVSRRNMASIKNWKRPTIEEIGVPTESWEVVNQANQAKYTKQLLASLSFFVFTVSCLAASGKFPFYWTPWDLIYEQEKEYKKQKGQ